ncbi:glycosyltransferase family 4 protein [Empedobacter falsenii]
MINQSPRIVFVINDITLSAGTERAVINLAGSFVENNYRVKIISTYSSDGVPFFDYDKRIEIVHLGINTNQSLVGKIKFYYKASALIEKNVENGDVLIGTNHAVNSIFPRVNKRKKIISIGCEHMDYWAATKPTQLIRKLMYPKLDAVVVLTNDDKIQYNKEIPTAKCFVIPNQYSFLPEETAKYESKTVIAIGRLERQKGFDILLDDLHILIKNKPDWNFKIIGNGSMKDLLQTKITEYGLSNVEILPPTKNVKDEFLNSSIYLMTSRNEGLPMVLLEAKACGLPIVSYNCPTGPKDLIWENDGFLIALGDKTSMIQSLERLMNDVDLRKSMGLNARHNVQKFSPKSILDSWEALLNKM